MAVKDQWTAIAWIGERTALREKPSAPSPLPHRRVLGITEPVRKPRCAIIKVMNDDNPRQEAATSTDLSRHAATTGDSDYSLSIDDALARYEQAGLPRTPRSIQRYCAKGDLDCHRVETPFGVKFLITPESVDRHIAYIKEVRLVATSRDVPRHVATDVAAENKAKELRQDPATSGDQERQAATERQVSQPVAANNRVIELLERENEFLRGQVAVKDQQIADMQERAHETNALINGLQRLLAPLLSAPDRDQNHSMEEL